MKVVIKRSPTGYTSGEVHIENAEQEKNLEAGFKLYSMVARSLDKYIQARRDELAAQKATAQPSAQKRDAGEGGRKTKTTTPSPQSRKRGGEE